MTPGGSARARVYGLRTRVRVARRQAPDDRDLLRWYPRWQLVDPYAFLDLTTPWEQAWVRRWCATEHRSGAIVELGPWLGAVTRAIVDGLDGRSAPVRVHDTFRFVDVEDRVAGTPLDGRLRDGEDFRPLHAARVGAAVDGIDVVAGDVRDAVWDDGPVELLFVDLAKEWEVWRHLRATFLRHLVVGGVVVQQDWAHAHDPWLHLWHHRWRDHFETVGQVSHSSSVVFRLARALPEEAIAPDLVSDYAPAEVRAAFAWAAALVAVDHRPAVAGAEVMLHVFHGDLDDALAVALRVAAEVPVTGELASFVLPELARRIHTRNADQP